MVQIHFLGSGDAFGSGGRFQPCILLESAGERILLDCGVTSLVALKRAGIDPNTISHVLLTHFHGDHFGGLPFLVLDGQFSHRERPLVIVGPPGVRDRVNALMEVMYTGSSTTERRFPIVFEKWSAGSEREAAGFRVTPFHVDHESGGEAFALRVTAEGKTIAYSGDSAWCEGLVDVSRGADLFIVEASLYDRDIKLHVSYATLARERSRIGCPRIILVHMSDETLEHDTPRFERSEDGLLLTV